MSIFHIAPTEGTARQPSHTAFGPTNGDLHMEFFHSGHGGWLLSSLACAHSNVGLVVMA